MQQLHEKQRETVRSTARFNIIRAGRRSGKTTVELEKLLFVAVQKKDRNVFFVSPTQKQSRGIVWEALKSRLGNIGIPNESRLEMKIPTIDGGYSTIFIAGWENRENFRGMKANHITFDELDTMRDFFIGWQEIFRPALIDTQGTADFIGTPKKENPNLMRLEKEADSQWECFHFKTEDNPFIPKEEIEKARAEMDKQTFRQEILAEYVENEGALFKYTALLDVFSNAIDKKLSKYLIIDVADDGSDKTKFSFWEGLEEYRRETFDSLNTESIVAQIREYQTQDKIPMSNTLVDAIGVGSAVASNSMLNGIIGFKSSYSPIKTDLSPVYLQNVHYTKDAPLTSDYANLRSQCIFELSRLVNDHKIASKVTGRSKEAIIEELSLYQDVSKGDGKRFATPKEDIKEILGHSPDDSDTWIMRMYFFIRDKMLPNQSEQAIKLAEELKDQFNRNIKNQVYNDTR
jgi:hypothetical protein